MILSVQQGALRAKHPCAAPVYALTLASVTSRANARSIIIEIRPRAFIAIIVFLFASGVASGDKV